MRLFPDVVFASLIPLSIFVHLVFSPYTKVEESFNIQATHDILFHGIPYKDIDAKLRANYDHLSFPGSVPRTFVGPLALAVASWPFKIIANRQGQQLLVRAILGLFNASCLLYFRDRVGEACGRNTANWYSLFQASQFHVTYYGSRTLPNFLAFGCTTIALADLLPISSTSGFQSRSMKARYKRALTLLTVMGIIFRSELAVLVGTYTLWFLIMRRISPLDAVEAGLYGAVVGLFLTVPIDSFFWVENFLWPELKGFIYNVWEGKASNWGTTPIYYYLSSALPRLLLNPLSYQVCIPFALFTRPLRDRALDLLVPNVSFIFIYSFVPHKEWRFIIYSIPPITAAAALGASWIWTRRARSFAYKIISLGLMASTIASFAASLGMLAISRLNYPGAEALMRLHALEPPGHTTELIRVHMDTLACMTGVTHFLENGPPSQSSKNIEYQPVVWIYDKTENASMLLLPTFWDQFDYALVERPEKAIGKWDVIDTVNGFAGIQVLGPDDVAWATKETPWEQSTYFVGSAQRFVIELAKVWGVFGALMRTKVTRGWWIQARMEPKIRILKNIRQVETKVVLDRKEELDSI